MALILGFNFVLFYPHLSIADASYNDTNRAFREGHKSKYRRDYFGFDLGRFYAVLLFHVEAVERKAKALLRIQNISYWCRLLSFGDII